MSRMRCLVYKSGTGVCRLNGARKRRGLGDDGEPAHVGKIILGRSVQQDGKTVRTFSRGEAKSLLQGLANFFGGGATAIDARGLYQQPGRARVEEKSIVMEVVSSGSDSCKRFHARLSGAAARAARRFQQDSVLVESHCADGTHRAGFVDKDNKRAFRLPGIR